MSSARKWNEFLPWSWQVLVTVKILSVKRSPASDWLPKQSFVHWTAGRIACSALHLQLRLLYDLFQIRIKQFPQVWVAFN
jgi:hypothetical protein